MRTVAPEEWGDAMASLRAEGYVYLDLLAGVDRVDAVEVVAHVVHGDPTRAQLLAVRVAAEDAHLPSIVPVYPAAEWHEREIAEMFGVVFDGHPDPRPLLRRSAAGRPPLLKDAVLAARAITPWPGAVDEEGRAGSRRRQAPPGVPEAWLAEPEADA